MQTCETASASSMCFPNILQHTQQESGQSQNCFYKKKKIQAYIIHVRSSWKLVYIIFDKSKKDSHDLLKHQNDTPITDDLQLAKLSTTYVSQFETEQSQQMPHSVKLPLTD